MQVSLIINKVYSAKKYLMWIMPRRQLLHDFNSTCWFYVSSNNKSNLQHPFMCVSKMQNSESKRQYSWFHTMEKTVAVIENHWRRDWKPYFENNGVFPYWTWVNGPLIATVSLNIRFEVLSDGRVDKNINRISSTNSIQNIT